MSDDETRPDLPRPRDRRVPGLLLLGVGLGALVAAVTTLRRRGGARRDDAPGGPLEMELRDEQPWVYETSTVIFAPAGAVAGHLHEVGGLPGLVGPLDGPPMDRVDWTEPGGARLRVQVHARSGGGPTDVHVKVARGARDAPPSALSSLEGEVRHSLVALRKELERA